MTTKIRKSLKEQISRISMELDEKESKEMFA